MEVIHEVLGKPHEYIMVEITNPTSLVFGKDSSPCAMVQVSSIGFADKLSDLGDVYFMLWHSYRDSCKDDGFCD